MDVGCCLPPLVLTPFVLLVFLCTLHIYDAIHLGVWFCSQMSPCGSQGGWGQWCCRAAMSPDPFFGKPASPVTLTLRLHWAGLWHSLGFPLSSRGSSMGIPDNFSELLYIYLCLFVKLCIMSLLCTLMSLLYILLLFNILYIPLLCWVFPSYTKMVRLAYLSQSGFCIRRELDLSQVQMFSVSRTMWQ